MEDWKYTQRDPSECLAKLHHFSIIKKHASGETEAVITVKGFATPKTNDLKFYAAADIDLNQKTLRFKLFSFGETLMGALAECLRNLRKFDYECDEQPVAPSTTPAP